MAANISRPTALFADRGANARHLDEGKLYCRDQCRDNRVAVAYRVDRDAPDLVSIAMTRSHQVSHQGEAQAPCRQQSVEDNRTHARRPHVMIDSHRMPICRRLPSKKHCASQSEEAPASRPGCVENG